MGRRLSSSSYCSGSCKKMFINISEHTTDENPYLIIEGDKQQKLPPLILEKTAGCHYQSYLQLEAMSVKEMSKVKPVPKTKTSLITSQKSMGEFPATINLNFGLKLKSFTEIIDVVKYGVSTKGNYEIP